MQFFACFTAGAAARQRIRLFVALVPLTKSLQIICFKGDTQGGTPWAIFSHLFNRLKRWPPEAQTDSQSDDCFPCCKAAWQNQTERQTPIYLSPTNRRWLLIPRNSFFSQIYA